MTKLEEFKRHLRPGHVYRRGDLAQWSNAVDRHLRQLVDDGTLTKLGPGLYSYPKETVFGKAPAEDDKLVKTFLKDRRFLLASPNAYNRLGVGTTQLYDKTVVYNHKRHGNFSLGGRTFEFRVRPSFPKTLNKEFLLVDLVNNLDRLAESKKEVLTRVKERVASYNAPRLRQAARDYGNVGTKKFFLQALKANMAPHAGRSLGRPPVEVGSGTNPSQAPKSRANAAPLPIAATVARKDRSDARHRHQPFARWVLIGQCFDLAGHAFYAFVQPMPVTSQFLDHMHHASRQTLSSPSAFPACS
jgi:hypothetical protein